MAHSPSVAIRTSLSQRAGDRAARVWTGVQGSAVRVTTSPKVPDESGHNVRAVGAMTPRRSRCAACASAFRFGDGRRDRGGGRPRPRGADGRVLRPARPERRGQVDDDADADRADARRRGRDLGARLRAAAGIQAVAPGDGGRAAARQPRRGAHLPADPDGVRAPVSRARARSAPAAVERGARDREPAGARGHDREASSPAACAGGCWSRAG